MMKKPKSPIEDFIYFAKYSGAMSVIARQKRAMGEAINDLLDGDIDAAIRRLRGWVKKDKVHFKKI